MEATPENVIEIGQVSKSALKSDGADRKAYDALIRQSLMTPDKAALKYIVGEGGIRFLEKSSDRTW